MSDRPQLRIVPCELSEANAFVSAHHRHHPAVVGHKFSQAVVDKAGTIRGVAITGRPNARGYDDGWTLEVTRCCTDGTPNACSALYGAARRATFALGYRRLITYTAQREGGTSLRASGFKVLGEVKGRQWDCASRPRIRRADTPDRFCWEATA
jgi:hypothetical protein